jgi:hypothetical protein
MTMYMTKTWGFSVPCGPLQFSLSGFRDRARGLLQPGDLVAIVGTFGANTPEQERGMILGLMEPSTVVVSSLDYFDLDAVREVDRDEHGNYRWPFGLELRAAWRFTEPRTALGDISARQFHMDSAQGIVPLLPNEADAILNLPRESVPLLSPLRARVRVEGLDAARRRAAPRPSTTRTGIMHLRRAPAFTYAMRLEGATTSAFKIGWAFDWKQRERQFNQAAMPAAGGLRYRTVYHEIWETAFDAFRMEQALLRHFDSARHPQNREVVSAVGEDKLLAAWIRCLQATKQTRQLQTEAPARPVQGSSPGSGDEVRSI